MSCCLLALPAGCGDPVGTNPTPPSEHVVDTRPSRSDAEWEALLEDITDETGRTRARAREIILASGKEGLPWLIQALSYCAMDSTPWVEVSDLLLALRPEGEDVLYPQGRDDPRTGVERLPHGIDELELWRRVRAWEGRSPEAWEAVLRDRRKAQIGRLSIGGTHARYALAAMGAESIPVLLRMIGDPEARIRYWGLSGLKHNAEAGREVLEPIALRLRDDEPEVSRVAVRTLTRLAESGRIDAGLRSIGDAAAPLLRDRRMVRDVLRLFSYYPPSPSEQLVADLVAVLRDETQFREWRAVIGQLGRMGPAAGAAVFALNHIIDNDDDWGRIDAAERAISDIQGE